MQFQSIYTRRPKFAEISSSSEVIRDESLTISQIISLHLRGIPANVHIYDEVSYETGLSNYLDERIDTDYFDMERDLTDLNPNLVSSGDYTPPQQNNGAIFLGKQDINKDGALQYLSETDTVQNERSEI